MATYLDFEKPIAELEARDRRAARDREQPASSISMPRSAGCEEQAAAAAARHLCEADAVAEDAGRPPSRAAAFQGLCRRAGRGFRAARRRPQFRATTSAIIGGLGRIGGRRVMLIGHEKGDDTASRLKHNFGMAKPEGYRKAIRLMQLADRFGLPVVTLVDTPGAFPGVQAEERGQAEAIARSTEECLALGVPLVAAIVGEGGSGGAIAIAAANRVLMFEHAVYSVISPEGCASILWRTADKAAEAAEAMRITAQDLQQLGVIDRIVPEPLGGAHREPAAAIAALGRSDRRGAGRARPRCPAELRARRRRSFSTSVRIPVPFVPSEVEGRWHRVRADAPRLRSGRTGFPIVRTKKAAESPPPPLHETS